MHLEKAVDISPEDTQTRINLATFYSQDASKLLSRKEHDHARDLLEKAVEVAPSFTPARYRLAVLLDREGNRETAVEHLTEILRINPSHERARRLLQRIGSTGSD